MAQSSVVKVFVLLLCIVATHVKTKSLSDESYGYERDEVLQDSSLKSIEKRAIQVLPVLIKAAPIFKAVFGTIFSGASFLNGKSSAQKRIEELKKINQKLDQLQKSVEVLDNRMADLKLGQEWLEGVTLYGNDVQRLRHIIFQMNIDVQYCEKTGGDVVLKSLNKAKAWAESVLDNGSDGLKQVLFSMHDLVMGTNIFGKRSLIALYKDRLGTPSDTNPGTFTQDMEDFVRYIMTLESGGYAAVATAMNVLGKAEQEVTEYVQTIAKPRMVEEWREVLKIVGVPSAWRETVDFTPPYHIAVDGYNDVGARFVDLNGDGKLDMVYHRYINGNYQQKGAYLNNGNGWTLALQYTPPYHIAADGYNDVGARFVELNGDGKIDMVYHRYLNSNYQQKGAYLNNGNGWTLALQYTPPYHIAVDGYSHDMGARFIDLNGDGKVDMVYHRYVNSNYQQKGAYLNNGNGWTLALQYTPPIHIVIDGIGDAGVRFIDFNSDGKPDMVYHRYINGNYQQKGAYLNNGNGWDPAPKYTPPYHIAVDGYNDVGARFVELNGDGKIDMVYHRYINGNYQQKGAYLNNGNGWDPAPQYTPPYHIAVDGYNDVGARFVELNGDGQIDMVYHRYLNGNYQQKGAYLNLPFFGDRDTTESSASSTTPGTCTTTS